MTQNLQDIFSAWNKDNAFSGVFALSGPEGVFFRQS